jgi:hypothetical protein
VIREEAPMPTSRRFLARTAILISTAALAAGAVSIPAGADPAPAPDGDRPPSGAPPLPEIVSSTVFANGPRYETAPDGTRYSPLDEPPYIAGHDNGQSALYDNGRGLRFSFWSNGDTGLTRPNGDGKTFIGNTGMWTTDLKMSDNVSDWTYYGGADGPREPWKLNAAEEAWNEDRHDTDPDTPGCQPGPDIAWMQCGDEYAIWGGGIVADPKNRRMLSFYSLIKRFHAKADSRPDPDNPGQQIPCTDEDIENRVEACRVFLFDGDGVGIAVWNEGSPDGDWHRMNIKHATNPAKPTALWPFDDDPSTPDVQYSNAIFAHDGYVYSYGCPGFLASACELGRVWLQRPGDVYDRAAWRFFAGHDRDRAKCPALWSADETCASPLEVDTDGGPPETMDGGAAGSSVFWNPALRMFMQIYSFPLKNDLMYRVAYRPEGPWSKAGLLGMAVPANGTGLGSISYAGFAHPEYAEKGGLVQYITYAHTTGFLRSDLGLHRVEFRKR